MELSPIRHRPPQKAHGAYSDKSPLVCAHLLAADTEMAVYSTEGRAVVFHTASLSPKSSRSTQGVGVMTLKPKYRVSDARPLERRPSSIRPATGRAACPSRARC